jgi:hypothetical protein
MISRRQLPELRAFAIAEERLPLRFAPEYASLVVPNGNSSAAGHRWFKFKEAFSGELLNHLLRNVDSLRRSECAVRMLDPFCGVGTSLLSAQLFHPRIESLGIECNPFSAFVARTKLAWPQMQPAEIRAMGADLLRMPLSGELALPGLSSIRSGRCITRHMARQIVFFRNSLAELPPSPERDALVVGLASTIEPVSRIRRDGRALRIVQKGRVVFRDVLADRWNTIAEDVEALHKCCAKPGCVKVFTGDGRRPAEAGVGHGSIDLILTSPPYPNNIDYNEVYKLELWFLGFTKQPDDFLNLRRATYRSHPTCRSLHDDPRFDRAFLAIIESGSFADLLRMVIRRVTKLEKVCSRGRAKVLLGYVHDTWLSLQEHLSALRPGGHAVYVVGNSLHGGAERPYLVPTDLIFAELAKRAGFHVEDIIVARGLRRRLAGNHFLRDSIVVLQKE